MGMQIPLYPCVLGWEAVVNDNLPGMGTWFLYLTHAFMENLSWQPCACYIMYGQLNHMHSRNVRSRNVR